jgi:putative nucleotidyltransferase with HDIG domain
MSDDQRRRERSRTLGPYVHAVEARTEEAPKRPPSEGTRSESAADLGRFDLALTLAVFAAGAAFIAYLAPRFPFSSPWELKGLILLSIFALTADRFSLPVYGETKLSISFISMFAAAVLFGPTGVAIVGPLTALSVYGLRDVFSTRSLFNIGNAALSGTLGAATYQAIAGLVREDVSIVMVPAALAGAAVAYGVNSVLVSESVSVATRRTPWAIWKEKGQWFFPHYLVLGLLGLALALAYRALGVAGLLAFVAPPVMMHLATRQYMDRTRKSVTALQHQNEELEKANAEILEMADRLAESYHGTLETLVMALDARDRETKGHSARVAQYTMEMARRMGIEEGSREWTDIQRAALLHDVGKIGVPDEILHKPGPLSPEEWRQMRKHPAIGHEMLKGASFLSAASEIVRSHHERYDGKGYPRGLAGEAIPLGARIFAVADTFDAMTSDRPYRKALGWELAHDEIVRNSGTQFDPRVVETFLALVEDWVANLQPREESRAA